MFNRFSDAARRIVVLMQEEARDLWHPEIATEHLVLALPRVDPDLLAADDRARDVVLAHRPRAAEPPDGHLPFTPNVRRVLEQSMREALRRGSDTIEPRHLLLAVLDNPDCGGVAVLRVLGVDLAALAERAATATPAVPADTDLAVRVGLLEAQVRALKAELRELRGRLDG
jgi:ATP-dependent Clp protease ATP-binding subunit ClpC